MKPSPRPREFAFTDDDFTALSALVTHLTGIHLPPEKSDMIYGRLVRRLRSLRLPNFEAYRSFIQQPHNAAELKELVNALTTPVSQFWREPHHFRHLEQVVLPWVKQQGRTARIWSAGCAAGQEAYTLGMMLERSGIQGKILATDINTEALKTAQGGLYKMRELIRLPPGWQEQHWLPEERLQWRAQPSLQARLTFRLLNLHEPWPPLGKFDAIFCRNVMIYFDTVRKKQLLAKFAGLLQPGGWLYIGHAENILPLDARFRPAGRTIYRLNEPAK